MWYRLLFLMMLLGFASNACAHPFHFSIAEAGWNTKTSNWEIALNVQLLDLREAISLQQGKRVSWQEIENHPHWVEKYLSKTFLVKLDKKLLPLKWVGMEGKVKVAWLYFEIPVPRSLKKTQKLFFNNQIFCSFEKNQVNIINFCKAKQKASLWFKRARGWQQIRWKKPKDSRVSKDSSH